MRVDAKKSRLTAKDALDLVEQVDHVYASKGKQVVHLDLRRSRPDETTLLGLLLGPTGNLRAPTIRVGRTLLVGFDEAAYADVLSVRRRG